MSRTILDYVAQYLRQCGAQVNRYDVDEIFAWTRSRSLFVVRPAGRLTVTVRDCDRGIETTINAATANKVAQAAASHMGLRMPNLAEVETTNGVDDTRSVDVELRGVVVSDETAAKICDKLADAVSGDPCEPSRWVVDASRPAEKDPHIADLAEQFTKYDDDAAILDRTLAYLRERGASVDRYDAYGRPDPKGRNATVYVATRGVSGLRAYDGAIVIDDNTDAPICGDTPEDIARRVARRLGYPDDGAKAFTKYDDDKPRTDLLPPRALLDVAAVLGHGARKYSAENWRLPGTSQRRYIAAALRHILAHLAGDTHDDESGLTHLAHAAACVLFAMELDDDE